MEKQIVVAALIEKDGEYLICQRAPHKTHAGLWEFPGGKAHQGESLATALEREISEELQIAVKAGELVAADEFRYNTSEVHLFVLKASLLSELDPNQAFRDHGAIRFVKPEELATLPMTSADLLVIPQILKRSKIEVNAASVSERPAQIAALPTIFEIASISALSTGKIFAFVNLVIGLFMALGILFLGMFVPPAMGGVSRISVALMLPVMNLIVGFAIGLILAFFYNLIAALLGGIRLRINPR